MAVIVNPKSHPVNTDAATLLSGEDQTNDVIKVEHRFSYKHLNALASTAVKSTPGFLHSLTINTVGASADTITIYDGTSASGTVIAVIDGTAAISTRIFDVEFTVGLFIVIATGTAADITISYR